ncbi:VOC family protein [Paenibacillus tarimensis]
MITHFSHLDLNTVSVEAAKQFYHDQLQFPIVTQSDREISFKPTEYFTLTFKQSFEPLAPAHIAFEVPYSEFANVYRQLRQKNIHVLKWPDGKIVDDFGKGKNVYFRDGDGNLLEIITHNYIKEDVLSPSGALKILYLREVGFPVDSVAEFRELLVQLFDFKLSNLSDDFTFAIGGTAHAVISSKGRKWIPIAMTALPPCLSLKLGVTNPNFIDKVRTNLDNRSIHYEMKEESELHFRVQGYHFILCPTDFSENIPYKLNLPYSR